MLLGMMINDGDEMRTGGPLTYDGAYKKPGGIVMPVIRTPYEETWDTFIIRRDPVTGEIYEGGPREIPAPEPRGGLQYQLCPDGVNAFPDCPDSAPPRPKPPVMISDPGPISYAGGSADFDEATGRYRDPNDPRNSALDAAARPQSSIPKPLLIAGAVALGFFLLKD
jgi:hypothetical protein